MLMNSANADAPSGAKKSQTPEELAYNALAFLTRDIDRIERFLTLTGVDPSDLRKLAPEPGFQLAVLDHLAEDEALLTAFAQECNVPPEAIGRARHALGGGNAL